MPLAIIAEGSGRKVQFWSSRELPRKSSFCLCPDIPLKDEKRIKYLISEYFIKQGSFPKKPEKYKRVEGKLFEIKSFQMRLMGFFVNIRFCGELNYEFIIVLCVKKKQDDLLPSDVDKALRNIDLCIDELKKDARYEICS